MLTIDRGGPATLRDQLYQELRAAIQTGRLGVGAKVPPTRRLAAELGVSRLTVEDAYARLTAEGMLVGRHGAGTYVTPEAAALDGRAPQRHGAAPAAPTPVARDRRWSRWAARLPAVANRPAVDESSAIIAFRSGLPDVASFPWTLWGRLLNRAGRDRSPLGHDYGPSHGVPALRAAIAGYLRRSRQLPHAAERIVITSGFQQGVDLLARLLLEPGDVVAIEEPGYPGARLALTAAGARLVPIPVDAEGLRVDRLRALAPGARLVYVTPSHQYPTGHILSLARRGALLAWARETGAVIIEDDYDAEFRYGARPVPALAGLTPDASERVAYLGTFSKVLFPGLRLGYVALPADIVDRFVAAKRVADYYSPTLEQVALAELIDGGHFERHVIRMRRRYTRRREATLAALTAHLGAIATWEAAAAFGLQLLLTFPAPWAEADLLARAAAAGVGLDSAAASYALPPPSPRVILGFAALDEARITAGLARLGGALRDGPGPRPAG